MLPIKYDHRPEPQPHDYDRVFRTLQEMRIVDLTDQTDIFNSHEFVYQVHQCLAFYDSQGGLKTTDQYDKIRDDLKELYHDEDQLAQQMTSERPGLSQKVYQRLRTRERMEKEQTFHYVHTEKKQDTPRQNFFGFISDPDPPVRSAHKHTFLRLDSQDCKVDEEIIDYSFDLEAEEKDAHNITDDPGAPDKDVDESASEKSAR